MFISHSPMICVLAAHIFLIIIIQNIFNLQLIELSTHRPLCLSFSLISLTKFSISLNLLLYIVISDNMLNLLNTIFSYFVTVSSNGDASEFL